MPISLLYMGLCLLRIISFVVSQWRVTVSWLLKLHHTALFREEKMAFFFFSQTFQYSGYFRQSSSWPCLGQSRSGLGLLKDLLASEKLRYWDSQEKSFAPFKKSSLPRCSEPLYCLNCACVVSSRLTLSGQHSKSQNFFFQIYALCLNFWSSVSFPLFPKIVLGFMLFKLDLAKPECTWQCGRGYV